MGFRLSSRRIKLTLGDFLEGDPVHAPTPSRVGYVYPMYARLIFAASRVVLCLCSEVGGVPPPVSCSFSDPPRLVGI